MSTIESQGVPVRRYSRICTAAVAVTVASGTFALGALLLGSPRAFGLALVLCSAGWLVTHFVTRLAARGRESHPRRHAMAGHRPGWSSSAYSY